MEDFAIGMACCLVSGVAFGSMFVPIRPFDTKDGFFVQWVQSATLFVFGVCVFAAMGFPHFYPVAALGGVFFATGNITAVPIINLISMGLGLLIWGSVQVLVGWVTARFGLFGLKPQPPKSDLLNVAGVLLSFVSAVLFAFVKPHAKILPDNDERAVETVSSAQLIAEPPPSYGTISGGGKRDSFVARNRSMIIGVVLAAVAGVFYGEMLSPVVYIQDNYSDASPNGLTYVFSSYCGTFVASTVYFAIYCVYKKNKPYVNAELVLPSMAYGLIWAVAMTAWFVSNQKLSQAISFPINTRLPGIIGSLWSVLYFKEITGRRNLAVLSVAIGVALVGVILVGLSKEVTI